MNRIYLFGYRRNNGKCRDAAKQTRQGRVEFAIYRNIKLHRKIRHMSI